MPFPIKICVECGEEFELKPNKPGFANRCPECSQPEATATKVDSGVDADDLRSATEINAARRKAIRDMLYRGDS
ncbi:MAG: hypothetical protein ACRD3F_01255 [Acidobacteriaceae bacterium]